MAISIRDHPAQKTAHGFSPAAEATFCRIGKHNLGEKALSAVTVPVQPVVL
jgi:hypothetical protein